MMKLMELWTSNFFDVKVAHLFPFLDLVVLHNPTLKGVDNVLYIRDPRGKKSGHSGSRRCKNSKSKVEFNKI